MRGRDAVACAAIGIYANIFAGRGGGRDVHRVSKNVCVYSEPFPIGEMRGVRLVGVPGIW